MEKRGPKRSQPRSPADRAGFALPRIENCRFCDEPIDATQFIRTGACESPECVRKHLREGEAKARTEGARRRAERVKELEAERLSTLPELQPDKTGTRVRIPLPSNNQAVVILPTARREAFEAHLRAIVAKAGEEASTPPDEPPATDGAGNNPVNRLLAQACGTCRGWCCYKGGGKNAYLKPESIQVYRQQNPGVPDEEIVSDYLSRIPDESYEDSCVFHGRQGCVLPRRIRSETCNWFLCDALIELSRRAALRDRATVFAAALTNLEPDRLELFDAEGVLWAEEVEHDVPETDPHG